MLYLNFYIIYNTMNDERLYVFYHDLALYMIQEMLTMSKVIKLHNFIYKFGTNAILILAVVVIASYLFGIRTFCVKTGSMGDAVPMGSLCFVNRSIQFESIDPGEIIAFIAGDDLRVTHRAVEVSEDGITTRGDVNNVNDPELVTKETYIGQTIFCVPNLGYFVEWMYSGPGIVVIALIVLLIQISGVVYFITTRKKKRGVSNAS